MAVVTLAVEFKVNPSLFRNYADISRKFQVIRRRLLRKKDGLCLQVFYRAKAV